MVVRFRSGEFQLVGIRQHGMQNVQLGVYGFEGVDAEPTVAEMSAADWKQQGLQRAAADVDVDKDSAVAKADVAAQNEFVVGLVAGPPGAVDTFAMVVGVVLQHFVG